MQLLQGNCPRGRRGFRNRSSPSANISQRKQIGEKNTWNNPTRVMATAWLRSQSQHPHLSIQPVSVPCANCRRAPVFPFVSLPCPWNLAGMRRKHPVFTRCSESAFHASGPPEAFPPTSHTTTRKWSRSCLMCHHRIVSTQCSVNTGGHSPYAWAKG